MGGLVRVGVASRRDSFERYPQSVLEAAEVAIGCFVIYT